MTYHVQATEREWWLNAANRPAALLLATVLRVTGSLALVSALQVQLGLVTVVETVVTLLRQVRVP